MDGHGQLGLAHDVAQAHPPGLHGHDPHLPLLHGAVGPARLSRSREREDWAWRSTARACTGSVATAVSPAACSAS